jgi:hypothetical protein
MSKGKHQSLLALRREGERFRETYRIERNGEIEDINAHTFDVTHDIDGVIRIIAEEYHQIDTSLPYYAHFNVEFCGHKIGARYVLPKIVARGYYLGHEDEVPPTLSFKSTLIGMCIGVRERLPYSALRPEDFRYAMKHIQNVEQLKKAIVARYSVSMPGLSEHEILERGVAMTTLRLEEVLA